MQIKITNMLRWSFILLLVANITAINAQSINYHKLIKSNKPGFKIIHQLKNESSNCEYLGAVKSPTGRPIYHVINQFTRLKAAITFHGNSRLLFFDEKEKLKYAYNMGMPDELPYKLLDNKLYFKSARAKTDTVVLNSKLPKVLCALDCYDLEIK
jgi:hypothetical protein